MPIPRRVTKGKSFLCAPNYCHRYRPAARMAQPVDTSTCLGVALGNGVSVGLLAAIFVSNVPESVGSASAMRAAGRTDAQIVRLWIVVAAICTLASAIGFAIADTATDTLKGGINGFAAGALLVMLVDSMIPEATRQAGRTTGLVTTLGFAVAAGLSGVAT